MKSSIGGQIIKEKEKEGTFYPASVPLMSSLYRTSAFPSPSLCPTFSDQAFYQAFGHNAVLMTPVVNFF